MNPLLSHIAHCLAALIIMLAATIGSLSAQYQTAVCKNDVKTLRLKYADSDALARPYIILGSDDAIEVSFDQMSHNTHFYSYTLLHLNSNFTPSDLLESEYIDGALTQDITDYELSSLTQTLYTHYRFTFPNDEMQPKVSGNYALKIYEDGNPDDVVAYAVFQVVEQEAEVDISIRGNTDKEYNGRLQQVDINLNLRQLSINSPDEITLLVRQNNREDNQVWLTRPTFIDGQTLRYVNNPTLIFEGGNEYRHFDISSEYILGHQVDYIEFDHRDYHAYLFADDNRSSTPYIYEQDANGQFVINKERTDYDDVEAEYMYVHFFLPAPQPWFTGGVYVVGDFGYNMLSPDTRMRYDEEHQCYVYTAFLKQGGYEYMYLLQEKGKTAATTLPTEGSFWQTNNEYSVFAYYRPFGARYDRLIGISRRL